MASGEQLMRTLITKTANNLNPIMHSNEPIRVIDAFKQAIDSRMGLTSGVGGKYYGNGSNKLRQAVGLKGTDRGGGLQEFDAPSDWQRFKSLAYNPDGTMNYGRAAGMAAGFGGGAIAGLNLGADIIF